MENNFCSNCGFQIDETTNFCEQCGTSHAQSAVGFQPTPLLQQNQVEAKIVIAKYHLLWVPLIALLATAALFVFVNFVNQLTNGSAFPREGWWFYATAFAVLATLVFLLARFMAIKTTGLSKGEYATARQNYLMNRITARPKTGANQQPVGSRLFNWFVNGRPVIVLMTLAVVAALGFSMTVTQPQNTTESSQSVTTSSTTKDNTPAAVKIEITGLWMGYGNDYDPIAFAFINPFIYFDGDTVVLGTYIEQEDLYQFCESGIADGTIEITDQVQYQVTRADIISLNSNDKEYLYSCDISISGSVWTIDKYHGLFTENGDYYYAGLPCEIKRVTLLFGDHLDEATLINDTVQPVLEGAWVLGSQFVDYTTFSSHAVGDITFLFFKSDGTVIKGLCSSASEVRSLYYNEPPNGLMRIENEFVYTIEDAAYTLDSMNGVAKIDACTIKISDPDGGSADTIWQMNRGSGIQLNESYDEYLNTQGCEFSAP